MHTICRFFTALWAYLTICAVFAIWGAIAYVAAGTIAPGAVAVAFAAIFFAPAAWINAWDDFGD